MANHQDNRVSIAESEANNEFFAEFLDDYFAECDEHLTLVRRGLLMLETFIDQPRLDRALLDELFRSFHSLKGISAMVGVRQAEQLAHDMESYLRGLRDEQLALTTPGLDGLIAGTKMLEQVVAARRDQLPAPDIASVMAQLDALVASPSHSDEASLLEASSDSATPHSGAASDATAAKGDKKIWRFEFAPSPALAERGINVNTVRARLQEIGELAKAAPRVLPAGGIVFEFVVATPLDESAFAAWRDDGISFAIDKSVALPESANPLDAATPATALAPLIAPPSIVRVSLGRLDELMRMVGEMVVSRSRLDDQLKQAETSMLAAEWRPLQETNLTIERQLRDMREAVLRVRMVPIGEIFERMQFVVRDLARESHKKVKLELIGQETEIDKLLVERMMDPLLHLVRNAVSHGLEPADEREAAGKPTEGKIRLKAFTSGEIVVIDIEDDGRGIDRKQVFARARAMEIIGAGDALDDAALLDLICSPGFSTRQAADRAAGRGVGMGVVRNTVQGLGGTLGLASEAGHGTRFTIQLPITLAIADALIVTVGNQRFAVPQSAVREVIEVEPDKVKTFQRNEVMAYRGGVLPIIRLARLFGLTEEYGRAFHAFVIGSGTSAAGIAVDRILGQREIVVRAISDPLIQVRGIAGATELGDGRVVLILDANGLISQKARTNDER
jgi:two-component system chemotaxis sensor kinase CheA